MSIKKGYTLYDCIYKFSLVCLNWPWSICQNKVIFVDYQNFSDASFRSTPIMIWLKHAHDAPLTSHKLI